MVSPIAVGSYYSVVWAVDASRKSPARNFFSGLTREEQAKILALFRRLAEHGHIKNRERFKKLEVNGGTLWEFKSFQLGFIGDFRPGKVFVVAYGLRKKSSKHKPRDLKTAARILDEDCARRKGNYG